MRIQSKRIRNKGKQEIFHILLLFSALISVLCCSINVKIGKGFEYISILPIIFLFFGFFLLLQLSHACRVGKNGIITSYIFVILQWLRLVILPLLGSVAGYFESYEFYVDEKSAYVSIFLIGYEAIITFLCCIIMLNYSGIKYTNNNLNEMRLIGNKTVYVGFIIISFIVFIVSGGDQYNFFAISLENERLSVSTGTDSSIITAVVDYGMMFFVILFLYWCYKNYISSNNKKYVYYALICALIRLCLISTEGRMSQVYLLGAFLLLLPKLFPEFKSKIVRYVSIIAVVVIGLMTVYKVFAAFLYDSYYDAIRASSFGLYDMATQIDIYFYGIKTVSRNIVFSNHSDLNLLHMFFDFLRNTFGIHYLFKGVDYTTLEYYNLFLYSGNSTSGHLFSSIAYGFQYFGPILAPICTCFNLIIAFLVEKKLEQIKNIEVYFIVSVVFVRFLFSIFSNFSQTWNVISRTLVIGMIVIGVSSLFTTILWKGSYKKE